MKPSSMEQTKITPENVREFAGKAIVSKRDGGMTGIVVGVYVPMHPSEPPELCLGHSDHNQDGWDLTGDGPDLEIFEAVAKTCKFGWYVRYEDVELLSEKEEKPEVFRPQHHVVVDMVAIRRGEVLLIRRGKDPFKGDWALPGGFVNFGERTIDAAARELQEETGLLVDVAMKDGLVKLIGVYDDPKRDPRGPNIGVAYGVVLSSYDTQEVVGGDDAAEARWFPLEDLPVMAFDHRRIILDAEERLEAYLY